MKNVSIVFCLFLSSLAQSVWAKERSAVVTFSFDDATRSQYTEAFPILQKYGFPGVLFVSSGLIDQQVPSENFFMNWSEVVEMHAADWEIGAHSINHTDHTQLSDAELFYEVVYSRDRIAAITGNTPTVYASPFGEYDVRALQLYREYFSAHVRAWGDDDSVNTIATVDMYEIERINVDDSLTAEEICASLQTVQTGDWVILMFHQVTSEASGDFISHPDQLEHIVECAYRLQDEGILRVKTISQVISETASKGEM